MNRTLIYHLFFGCFTLISMFANAQTLTWPFGEQGGDSLYMQPENFWSLATDSNDLSLLTARAENGSKFHYGYLKNGSIELGGITLDSDSSSYSFDHTAIIYNADTAMYMHTEPFFNAAYPRNTDNSNGLVVMTTTRSNGSYNVFTEAITVRYENDLSLKKEYFLTDFIGSASAIANTVILDSNKIGITLSYMVGNYVKMYSDINVIANDSYVAGGTEMSMDNVPNFAFGERVMIVVDMTTDSITGYSIDEGYFTSKSLGEHGYVDIIHGDTSITFNWYDSAGDSLSSFEDDVPMFLYNGYNASSSFSKNYSSIADNISPIIAYGRRGNSFVRFLSDSTIELTTEPEQFAYNEDLYKFFSIKGQHLYVVTSHEMNYHVDVYDLNVGPNALVTHFRNDVQFNAEIGYDLGTPDEFSIDVNGDSVTVSFVIESPLDATMSIGSMTDFTAYQDRSMSFSYDFVLQDNPLVTVGGYEVTYSSPDLEYVAHAGFHKDTLFVSPDADLENIVITINAGDSILSYLMYEDRFYLYQSDIDPIFSGSESDFSQNNARILHVSNRNIPNGKKADIYHQYNYCVVKAPDADSNGLSDFSEGILDSLDTDLDGIFDYLDPDNDNDGYSDIEEINEGSPADPNNNDEDGDGILNESHEDDDDSDGIANAFDDTNNIGISEHNSDLNIYSKSGSIYVKSSANISINLTDALGKNHGEYTGEHIEVHHLNQGVYFIQINSNLGITTKKIMVY